MGEGKTTCIKNVAIDRNKLYDSRDVESGSTRVKSNLYETLESRQPVPGKISFLFEWIRNHEMIIWWMGSLSLIAFLGLLISVPILVVKLPAEYFLKQSTADGDNEKRRAFPGVIYVISKNVLGIILVLAGFAMFFLPGQGLITLLIGLSLLSVPGKDRLVLKILGQKTVLYSLNRLRARFNKPAFRMPH